MKAYVDVALVVWNPDIIQLLSFVLQTHNLNGVGIEPSEGIKSIDRFLEFADAPVVVIDLEPPYNRSTAGLSHLLEKFQQCAFVVTCADPVLALRSAPYLARYPVFQKPYDLSQIVSTIQELTRNSSVMAVEMSN
jgi:DNA-binding LytR/AlgR family response regulator